MSITRATPALRQLLKGATTVRNGLLNADIRLAGVRGPTAAVVRDDLARLARRQAELIDDIEAAIRAATEE